MKKLLFFCCLTLSLLARAQSNDTSKYTPVNGYGYNYKRLKIDSSLMLALGDTTSKAPRQIKFVGNNIFYSDNAGVWHAMASGGGDGGGTGVSNIYTRNDSLFYTLGGSEYFVNAYFSRDSADARYYSITNPAGYLTNATVAGKLNYTDTALMLNPYLHKTDTSSMLTPYLKTTAGDARYPLLSGSYNNPSWLGGLAWGKLTGTPATLSGYGITDGYPLSGNPSNFLTSINSSNVTAALGFTPYNSTNPSGYITQSSTATLTNKSGNISQWTNDIGYTTQSNNDARYPSSAGSYSDPSWITSLAWSKLTGTPTTIAGYGITDAATLPSQTGQSGNYLITNGTSASWSPVSNPKYIGSLYNNNSWSTVTGDFTANNITAAISSNKITLTASGSGYSTLDYNYYSQLEHWVNTAKIKVTSTSAAMGVCLRAGTTAMTVAYVDFSTGYLYIKSTGASGATVDLQATSTGHLTVSTNDYILVTIERNVDIVYATARDITANSGLVTTSFQWKTDYSNGFTPSTGKYGVIAISGSATLDSLSVASTELVNPNLMIITDSKGEYSPTTWRSSWVQQIGSYYNPLVVSVDPGKGIDEVVERVPEILAINPKNILFLVGRNNYAGGTSVSLNFDTLKNRYTRLVTQLQAANINVLHMNGVYETNTNLSAYASWISSQFGTNVIDTYDPTAQVGSGNVYSDGIHISQAGHDLVSKTIVQSNLLKNGFNYNDIVRFGAPNADATHEGFVNTQNQVLGMGMKDIQEARFATNFVTYNTPGLGGSAPDGSGYTGCWMITNGSALLPYMGGINNLHIGVAAGTWGMTGTQNAVFACNTNTAQALTSGYSNFIWGNFNSATTDHENVVIGSGAASNQSGGNDNVYLGNVVAANATSSTTLAASSNVIAGDHAGYNATSSIHIGSNNVLLGTYTGSLDVASISNKLILGGGSSHLYGMYGDFNAGTYQIGTNAGQILLKTGMGLEVAGGAFSYSRLASSSGLPTIDGGMYYDTAKHKPYFYNGTTYTPNVISHSFVTPTTGISVTAILNNNLIVNPSGSLAALTITLPSASDGDMIYLTFKQAITSVTYSPAIGSVINVPTSATQGQQIILTYDSASGNWY